MYSHKISVIPAIFLLLITATMCITCDTDSPTSPNHTPLSNPFADIDILTVDNFLGFSLTPDSADYLKLQTIPNAAAVAAEYRTEGMLPILDYDPYPYLDENHVPIIHYSFGDHRNPVTTSHNAFAYYQLYLDSGSEDDKQYFINNIEWLCENCDENFYLHYDFDITHVAGVEMTSGWISAMAQGEALAALCMAYDLLGEERYLQTATGLFLTLYSNTTDTWAFMIDQDGYYWLEEYPNPDFCHVLNGFLFGLWGLWDYYVITGDEFALTLFEAGIKSAIDNISFWNIPGEDMSMYCSHCSVPSYHDIHITELQQYAEILKMPEFLDAIEVLHH